MRYCKCGCGTPVKDKLSKNNRPQIYILGHQARGKPGYWAGKRHSVETRDKMSKSQKLRDYKGFEKGHIPWNLGVPHSKESNERNRISHIGKNCGEKSYLWIDGRSKNKEYRSFVAKKHNHKRRCLKKNGFTNKEFSNLIKENIKNNLYLACNYCYKELSFSEISIDHKVPISRGGDSSIENIEISCLQCNLRKHTKSVKEFREYLTLIYIKELVSEGFLEKLSQKEAQLNGFTGNEGAYKIIEKI